MRKLKRLILGTLLAFLLVSCQSYKKVPYLQDTVFVNDTEQSVRQTGVKVMPKDLLTITVSCSTPELEIENLIIDKLKAYLKEAPLVTVRIVNYRISVLGEVTKPGSFIVSNERVNLLEALAMAGDLTIYGMRDNVKLIRTGQGNKQEIITLDLNKAETVMSPYYQLQQNDIIYVTPNKTKAKNSDIGTNTGLWLSSTSILVSLANILVILLK